MNSKSFSPTSETDLLSIIGRDTELFGADIGQHESTMRAHCGDSKFLVVGGAGAIGAAVVKHLCTYKPPRIDVIDLSENNLAELVRDVRSSNDDFDCDFNAYCFDPLGPEFDAFRNSSLCTDYDFILNFAALKHVRSEKDPLTAMRMLDVNIRLPHVLMEFARSIEAQKLFCVSSDKAANPASLMGASKRAMEIALFAQEGSPATSMSRFANVAFSDGSLPFSWLRRIEKRQPLVAPVDVFRYFVTPREAAYLCLFSIVQGKHKEIYFPRLDPDLHLVNFEFLAKRFLEKCSLNPVECDSEKEARAWFQLDGRSGLWPCYFFNSDTSGEKEREEFYTDDEQVDAHRYNELGVVRFNSEKNFSLSPTDLIQELQRLRTSGRWSKSHLVELLSDFVGSFRHIEKGKSLDQRM